MTDPETFLEKHGIAFVRHEHPPLFTCEDAASLPMQVPGIPCKNLFLKGKKSKRLFLVILPASQRTDLKQFAQTAQEPAVSFASAETLKEVLGLEPGSVSPFGLLNDTKHVVTVYVDRAIHEAPLVNFHPNRNTASLELTHDMFQKFLAVLPHEIHVMDSPEPK